MSWKGGVHIVHGVGVSSAWEEEFLGPKPSLKESTPLFQPQTFTPPKDNTPTEHLVRGRL